MSYLGEGSDFRGQTISRPPGKSNAVSQVSSYLGEGQDFAKENKQSIFSGNQNNKQNDNNSGIQAFQQTQQGGSGGGSGSNIAQQVLGDAYSQAIGLGYKPSELIDMVTKAQSFNRGIDVDKFKTSLDRFQGFQDADGGIFKFEEPQEDGSTITKQYLSVSRPELTANAPTLAQLLGDISGGISNMVGAGADFVMGGGATGRILEGIKNQFNQGRDFVGQFTNPGNLSQRLDASGPEARRKYAMFMQQPGMTYQRAFEMATGQAFAQGGVANL
tara:strand:+ start:472 stop:1290 length:819 start_codon:yes stop_codon:yes gene_type:complete